MIVPGQFQFRRDLSTNWSLFNPTLLAGELGIESDTDQFKLGDGITPWNSLGYGGLQGPPGVGGTDTDIWTVRTGVAPTRLPEGRVVLIPTDFVLTLPLPVTYEAGGYFEIDGYLVEDY